MGPWKPGRTVLQEGWGERFGARVRTGRMAWAPTVSRSPGRVAGWHHAVPLGRVIGAPTVFAYRTIAGREEEHKKGAVPTGNPCQARWCDPEHWWNVCGHVRRFCG